MIRETRSKYDWKNALNFIAHVANISVKGVAIMSLLWTFGGAVINDGMMMIDMNHFGELWFEIGLFTVLFALALYHEVRISKMRRTLVAALLFMIIIGAALFAVGPVLMRVMA